MSTSKLKTKYNKDPFIKIKYNLDEEVCLFLNFLHDDFFQKRKMIFKAFPKLEILLKNKSEKEEKLIIKKFIEEFSVKNNKKIKEIIERSENILKIKSSVALVELASLMDYKWSDDHSDFTAFPTILPFSPFKENFFYFSILAEILEKKSEKDILFISVHEISHMILFDILEREYKKPLAEIMPGQSLYFLKEILAPVLMNQKILKNMLSINNYLGNQLLHYLFIKTSAGEILHITIFFQNMYEIEKHEKKLNFIKILKNMIKIIKFIEEELKEKYEIWNKYGNEIIYQDSIFEKYKKPIKIK